MPILQWLTRNKDIRAAEVAPYRLLEVDKQLSFGNHKSKNMLIQGDNLDALKALLPYFTGQIKCIYIDPPYNTGAAFEHYDDNLEHATWLSTIYPRLQLLKEFLTPDGFFLCQIDDAQGAYLKVLCDEVFGRDNYQTTLYVQVRYAQKTLKQDMKYHKQIEQVLVYRASFLSTPNQPIVENDDAFSKFNYEVIEKAPGEVITLGGREVKLFRSGEYEIRKKETGWVDGLKEIWASGSILDGNSSGRFFRDFLTGRSSIDGLGVLYKVPNIGDDGLGFRYFTGPKRATATKGKYYQGVPEEKRSSESVSVPQPIPNFHDYAGAFGNCRLEGGADFRSGKKPEAWLMYLFERFSSEGDYILDSFLGSGSSSATALKMNRRFIGIEMGPQAITHCAERLKEVVKGEQTGISKTVNWRGGGGFRFYRLGPPVFTEDGQIQPDIRFPVLAAHIWFAETGQPWQPPEKLEPYLGEFDGLGYALLYNGILGDKSISGGNVLTRKTLSMIRNAQAGFQGPMVVYGERTALSETTLKAEKIEFKQTPYDVKARK
ncbi:MAG: site-specific DNA-methyltransferase [Idiomarinaceae bacterium]|nr:site-specific DNA-methyltransferase [Idiomarinaceae bacterium]|tara:strand:+ start:9330 stop:10964 length:1635 start_codon:yes stop_codon:yes gene_type:complete